jgi:galactose mutarotase-like enzyme
MSSCEQGLSDDGLQNICMQNRHVRLEILPDAGGKIARLHDQKSGRNWLWSNPHIPFNAATYDADFGSELDSGGWDEILLSVSPAELRLQDGEACRIPDHGDVVGQKWSVVDASVNGAAEARCEMAVNGRALRYEFSRTMRLPHGSRCLEIDYSLTNREAFACPWYWSLHALLTGEQDLRIDLPDKQLFRIDHIVNQSNGAAGDGHAWPDFPLRDGNSFDLSRCFDAETAPADFASKLFVRSPDSGTVSVTTAEANDSLTIRYDPDDLPWLGLWINNRGWSGCDSNPYRNLGLEPATAAFDSVCRAIDEDSIAWLQPGHTRSWSISVELQS